MFGLTTRGQIQDEAVEREFERLYARLTEFLSQSFDEDGLLITSTETSRVIGEVIDFAGPTVPSKWLLCDGSGVSRVTYKTLFETIGTTYGAGDGSTTFNLPDARQKFTLGKSVSGTGSILGEVGGAIDHTHTVGAHTHTITSDGSHNHGGGTGNAGGHNHSFSGSTDQGATQVGESNLPNTSYASPTHFHNFSGTTGSIGDHNHSITSGGGHDHGGSTGSSSGGSTGTSNPPYIVFNKIIYTGVA